MFDGKTELINEFDHNYIELVNGSLKSCNMKFEEKSKIKIEKSKSHLRLHAIIQTKIFIA